MELSRMSKLNVRLAAGKMWLAFALFAVYPFKSAQQVPNKRKLVGCFVDNFDPRILPDFQCDQERNVTECPACAGGGVDSEAGTGTACQNPAMTVDFCLSLCDRKGHVFAGLESGNECYCGNANANFRLIEVDLDECNAPCGGNNTQMCGETFLTSVYDLRKSCNASNLNPFILPSTPTVSQNEDVVFDTGDSLTFSCQSGYTLSGEGSSTCQADGSWIPSLPTCIRGVDTISTIKCPALPALENGTITPSQTVYTAGQRARFTCISGYDLQGSSERICGIDGQWRPPSPPTCVKILCPPPDNVTNGEWRLSSNEQTAGVLIVYRCSTGFALTGNSVRVCSDDGTWTGNTPTCVADTPDERELNAGQSTGQNNTSNNNGGGNGSNGSPPVSWITVLLCILIITFKQHYCSTI